MVVVAARRAAHQKTAREPGVGPGAVITRKVHVCSLTGIHRRGLTKLAAAQPSCWRAWTWRSCFEQDQAEFRCSRGYSARGGDRHQRVGLSGDPSDGKDEG